MPFKPRTKGKANIVLEKYPTLNPDDYDPILASKFTYTSSDPIEFCTKNALAAAYHGRHDYQRILESLAALLKTCCVYSSLWSNDDGGFAERSPMARGVKRM
jgi:hypothetical protein